VTLSDRHEEFVMRIGLLRRDALTFCVSIRVDTVRR